MTMQETPRAKPTFGYYRQPDGFITASPATSLDELKYRRGGWVPLPQYGTFEMATPYAASHPLEPLFMRGGAHELSERQIREQGLYIETPMVPACKMPLGQEHKRHTFYCTDNATPVVFPQLEHMTDLGPFPCLFECGRPPFPTVAARDQHATVMHAPEKSDQRTGESLAAALITGLGGANPVAVPPAPVADPPMMQAILQKMEAMQTELDARARPVAPPEVSDMVMASDLLIAEMRQQMAAMQGELARLKAVKQHRARRPKATASE
jgi:uncharacterized small protein (DUF1192 family)